MQNPKGMPPPFQPFFVLANTIFFSPNLRLHTPAPAPNHDLPSSQSYSEHGGSILSLIPHQSYGIRDYSLLLVVNPTETRALAPTFVKVSQGVSVNIACLCPAAIRVLFVAIELYSETTLNK